MIASGPGSVAAASVIQEMAPVPEEEKKDKNDDGPQIKEPTIQESNTKETAPQETINVTQESIESSVGPSETEEEVPPVVPAGPLETYNEEIISDSVKRLSFSVLSSSTPSLVSFHSNVMGFSSDAS